MSQSQINHRNFFDDVLEDVQNKPRKNSLDYPFEDSCIHKEDSGYDNLFNQKPKAPKKVDTGCFDKDEDLDYLEIKVIEYLQSQAKEDLFKHPFNANMSLQGERKGAEEEEKDVKKKEKNTREMDELN